MRFLTESEQYRSVFRYLHQGIHYQLRTFAGGRWAQQCRPVSIALAFTERCNARCVHCDIWKNRGGEATLAPDRWKILLKELRSWLGPVHVVITGGEALLRPYTPDVLSYGSSLGLFM